VFFFFQAEDGIRDSSVTGVQTCALPISAARRRARRAPASGRRRRTRPRCPRSEERREGKSVDLGGRRIIKKKKKTKTDNIKLGIRMKNGLEDSVGLREI